MSSIARWSYTEIAEVRPVLAFDAVAQKEVYGEVYQIKCAWQDKAEARISGETGEEFLSTRIYSTEDPRPNFGDDIRPISTLIGGDGWQRIKAKDTYPMSMFGKKEKPDFGLVT